MENARRNLKSFLCSLEKSELVDLLLFAAERNPSLQERLNQLKRKAEGQAIDLEEIKMPFYSLDGRFVNICRCFCSFG